MQFSRTAIIFLLFALLTTVHAANPQSEPPGIPLILQNGTRAIVNHGQLIVPGSGGKYLLASPGRYVSRDGTRLVIERGGRLDAKTVRDLRTVLATRNHHGTPPDIARHLYVADAKVPSAPTPAPKPGNGQYHQTGTNL